MTLPRHQSNGSCPRCKHIIDKYPGIHAGLRKWFEDFQSRHPEAHVSCAGRDEETQEALLAKRATRAKFGQSAHNYNCALDLFVMLPHNPDIYDSDWFYGVLEPELPQWLNWYGTAGSRFFELPHVEIMDWRLLAMSNVVALIGR